MNRHPGGDNHTLEMLRLAALRPGGRVLDMGAGDGEAVEVMKKAGLAAQGIDIKPGQQVQKGDMLQTPFDDASFDGVLAQCSFYVSGDVPGALGEAWRILKNGGKLMCSDVSFQKLGDVINAVENAGFTVLFARNMTEDWKEYYIESLWSGGADCLPECVPQGKCGYYMLICRKEKRDGSC